MKNKTDNRPEILAPAGNKASFLAAIAAEADAVYCGLKEFSARMEARNFSLPQMRDLTLLAHEKKVKVYMALNSLVKPSDIEGVAKTLDQIARHVCPDAVIVQDLALVELARQTGFEGEIHLSTLANASFGAALTAIREGLGVHRVVLPRELDIDEVKAMAQSCPPDMRLEVFVHGALCYGISGRCYWSSFLGGKSGLRGRCVQPCRRVYEQKGPAARLFSCQDLSLDVLVKVLLEIPEIAAWKIEGRKKGPHYVTYTVRAYRMLRDEGRDPKAKKEALALLDFALGRPGTHYFFLPQRLQAPVKARTPAGSGLMIGRIKGDKQRPYIKPAEEILPGDILRLGYEDEGPHGVIKVKRGIPKKGRLDLQAGKGGRLGKGTPVFLVDRREKDLEERMDQLDKALVANPTTAVSPSSFQAVLPRASSLRKTVLQLHAYRRVASHLSADGRKGYWLDAVLYRKIPQKEHRRIWWWLPPVVWPREEEELAHVIQSILKNGGRHFVLNAPYQVVFFEKPRQVDLWAGPFCNISNPLAIEAVARLGFSGVVVCPELGGDDFLVLPRTSPVPLGVVVFGNWPLTISRSACEDLEVNRPFKSPKGELAWIRQYGANYWVYPNWVLDMTEKKDALRKSGYTLFVHLHEPVPHHVAMKKRQGLWNWRLGLQ